MSGTIEVLLLAADPDRGTEPLRVDREIRGAVEAARMGGASHEVKIAGELAVCLDDLRPALLRHEPRIVHFAAHGSRGDSLLLDDGSRVVTAELVALFGSFPGVRVVVLTACGSLGIAEALSEVVDYVVAMERPVLDAAAIQFTGAFYAALAFGRTVPAAFDMARTSTHSRFGADDGIPHLLAREGAEERPLVDDAPAPAAIRQENDVEDAEAGGDADVTNEARIRTATPVHQTNRAKGLKAAGSLKIGNSLK